MTRRLLLQAAVPTLAGAGRVTLSREPMVAVNDFAQFPAILTPVEDFFVRSHFAHPEIDASAWRLTLAGAVRRPATLNWAELCAMPRVRVTVTVECAGNGSGMGGVSCAVWEGPPLAALLQHCGVDAAARWVRFTGLDQGREPDAAEAVPYGRSLRIERALREDVIVAVRMNGQTLPAEHGYPARLVAAGHYGMDSVKWLARIEVRTEPDRSLFMTRRFVRSIQGRAPEPIGPMRIKSQIVKPGPSEIVRGPLEVGGYAWSGEDRVSRVEVSLDDGRSWQSAELLERPERSVWAPWRLRAANAEAGARVAAARAFSEAGQVQPERRDSRRTDEYEMNQVHRVRFFFRP